MSTSTVISKATITVIVALVISHERAVQTAYFTYIRTYGDNRRITVYVVGLMVLYTGSTFMAGKERTER